MNDTIDRFFADITTREFLNNGREEIGQIDHVLFLLQSAPGDKKLLDAIRQRLHGMVRVCEFFGFPKIEALAREGECLMNRLCAGELVWNAEIAGALFVMAGAIREILLSLETTREEGKAGYSALIHALRRLSGANGISASVSVGAAADIFREQR